MNSGLAQDPLVRLQRRGNISVKGKEGLMETYWVLDSQQPFFEQSQPGTPLAVVANRSLAMRPAVRRQTKDSCELAWLGGPAVAAGAAAAAAASLCWSASDSSDACSEIPTNCSPELGPEISVANHLKSNVHCVVKLGNNSAITMTSRPKDGSSRRSGSLLMNSAEQQISTGTCSINNIMKSDVYAIQSVRNGSSMMTQSQNRRDLRVLEFVSKTYEGPCLGEVPAISRSQDGSDNMISHENASRCDENGSIDGDWMPDGPGAGFEPQAM